MRVGIFSTKPYDRQFLESANLKHQHELVFFEHRLTGETMRLAEGFPAICAFVNDHLSAPMLTVLAKSGLRLIALRCFSWIIRSAPG